HLSLAHHTAARVRSTPLRFYQCYADHQHLHSFPTRRSSDLEAIIKIKAILKNSIKNKVNLLAERVYFSQNETDERTSNHLLSIQDRKSTRLNSSHVKISYAVFCLKKKKQPFNVT